MFLRRKSIGMAAMSGFTITDEMKVTVAGQAALLVLGLDEPYYFDRVKSIILYPRTFTNSFRLYQRFYNRAGENVPGRPGMVP